MRKRIEELARGTFEQERPVPEFSVDKIELEVLEGQEYTGEFTITSINGVVMRGMVYTSDVRMECLTPQFEGTEVKIRYQFHSAGLLEGDVTKGDFHVIANQGEYDLSFVVEITRLYADSSVGKIKNLSDFTRLAKENFGEACRVFASKNFSNILKHAEARDVLLYEGLAMPPFYPQNVEEFLVGTGRKQSVLVSVDRKYREYYEIKENLKDQIEIRKDQWGYLELELKSDADFLVLEKEVVTSEDFIGSVCQVYYFIDAKKLHAGKNFARIYLQNASQMQSVEFCVSAKGKEVSVKKELLDMQSAKAELTEYYIDYRLKRMVTGVWASESCRLLSHMQALEPDNLWFPLMRAQALLINRQRQEALWILEEFKRNTKDTECPVYGYYLYLCTLVEREPSYVRKMTGRIEEIYEEWDENDVLFWVLLFLKEEYIEDDIKKLAVLKKKIEKGTASPFFYLEAYYLYQNNPYLLTSLGDTEIKILWWAARRKALNKDIAIMIMNLVAGKRTFEKRVYELLCEAYRYFDDNEMLAVICSYLIKGQCFAPCYLEWYARAVRENLHITNLNEAYMMSLDKRSIVNVPRSVLLYFQYDSNISYAQKAVLFVNIIANKEKEPGLYENYRKTMERFAMEQMEKGRIDDNLSVIYEEMLDEGLLTKEMSAALAKILYMHKIVCFSSEITAAVIVQPQLKKKMRVAFHGKSAYIPLFSNEFAILLEDRKGRRYTSLSYQIEKLMRPGRYLRKCMRYAPGEVEYALGFTAGKENFYSFDEKEGALLTVLLDSDVVSDRYKARLTPKILEYYAINDMDEKLEKHLAEVDFSYFDRESRRYVFSMLMERKMYKKAYQLIQDYGSEQMESAKLVSLCSYEIEKNGDMEDELLEGLCMKAVRSQKYSELLLRYLCRYYQGPTRQMDALWELSEKYGLKDRELEERILVQMLYTTEFVEHAGKVYEKYRNDGGNPLVIRAYLNYFAQSYFVDDMVIDESIFAEIKERFAEGEELSDACQLALLKYFALHGELQQDNEMFLDTMLAEYTGRGMYFSFYKHFSKRLQVKYFLQDKVFIEYHTEKQCQVSLNYSIGEDEFIREDMEHVYSGIYVKPVILFFGEAIQYYIEEKERDKVEITESAQITKQDVYGENEKNRYEFLNAMLMSFTIQDQKELERLMLTYEGKIEFTEKNFTII